VDYVFKTNQRTFTPKKMQNAEFRKNAHQLVDWMADLKNLRYFLFFVIKNISLHKNKNKWQKINIIILSKKP
jgi:hypothetical protein